MSESNSFEFGLPIEIIDSLEEKLGSFTFDSIVERLDIVFQKGWSYHIEGPDVVQVPKKTPINSRAKNPKSFTYKEIPHWHCQCSIQITWPDKYNEIIREYSVLVPVEDGSFEVARDLALIYTAYYGLGVGRKSKDIFTEVKNKTEIAIGEPQEVVTSSLTELESIKRKLGIGSNKELDPLVREWNSEMSSIEQINRTNIGEFVSFLRGKLENVGKPT